MRYAAAENDPLWRLPLWRPYEAMLESKVADINNVGGSQGGAITAALFMRRFVTAKSWLHLDLFAWTARPKPAGRKAANCRRRARSTRCLRRATAERHDACLRSSRHAGPRRSRGEASRRQGAAARFVEGRDCEVIEPQAPLRREPRPDAPLDTEALKGERVTVYDSNAEGCSWGQLAADDYVGWLPTNALAPRARRRPIRSWRCGLSPFPASRSSCRRSRRCRSVQRLPSCASRNAWR